jgi:PTH2 family peptidyl-tRNA hydrolase
MRDTKQVIVVRKDLNMRKGKIAAQASHASMSFLTRRMTYMPDKALEQDMGYRYSLRRLSEAEKHWLENSFAKICLYVEDATELLAVYEHAKTLGLEVNIIVDSGRTEFHGVPTTTCIAIGPDWCDKIDEVTKQLKLL